MKRFVSALPIELRRGANPQPYRHVHRDDRKANERQRVSPFCALRPVAEREDVTHDEQAEIQILQDGVDDIDSLDVERRVLQRLAQDGERDEEVTLFAKSAPN